MSVVGTGGADVLCCVAVDTSAKKDRLPFDAAWRSETACEPRQCWGLLKLDPLMNEWGPIFWTGKLMLLYQLVRSNHETYSPSYLHRRVQG